MNTSCFACKKGKCAALEPEKANCRRCRFFKTRAQAKAGREHALALTAAKPPEEQAYLSGKYYLGTMPWRKEGEFYDG